MKHFFKFSILIIVAAFLTLYFFKNNSQFIDGLKNHAVGTLSNIEIYEEPQPTPEIEFQDRDGNWVSLYSFKGKVVVANFWATWCLPCRVEMPDLERLARKVDPSLIKIITISLDRKGFEVIDPFLDEIGVTELEVFLDRSNRLSLEVGAIGLPTTLIIGPDSKILASLVGPAVWDNEEVLEFLNQAKNH
jgi:thiol-disulfide isomerase/thioredoxin